MRSAPRTVKNWPVDKVNQLRDLAKTHTRQDAAVEMGVSFYTLQHAAKVYGVSFNKCKNGDRVTT